MTAGAIDLPGQSRPFYETGKRSRDLAEELGLSEAALLDQHDGPEVVRLQVAMPDLINALPDLGEVMSLTRNDAAVHEKVGTFGNIKIMGAMGLVLNDAIDLRLFLGHWKVAFALELPGEQGPRRSLQIFDGKGDAVIKIHLKPQSNVQAFEDLRARYADDAPSPLPVVAAKATPVAKGAVDVDGFRSAFMKMQDVHEFHPLLTKFGIDRREALDFLGDQHAAPLANSAARTLLEKASERVLPIMCFVGNAGCIQIHHGVVQSIKVMGPWVNVLDPGFNLHLREDKVVESWLVKKPTRHGLITSVELYGADRSLIAQFFGVRDESEPEDENWRDLANKL